MLESIKKQFFGVMANTNKKTGLITIGLIITFTVVAVWFYRQYMIPALDEDAYMENNEYRVNHDWVNYYVHGGCCVVL